MADDKIVVDFEGQPDDLKNSFRDLFDRLDNFGDRINTMQDDLHEASVEGRRDMDRLGDEIIDTSGDMRDLGDSTLSFGKIFKANVAASLVTGGALKGIQLLTDGLRKFIDVGRESIEFAQEQRRVEANLEAVLTATGNAAGFTADQLKDHAARLQEITNYGDETTIAFQSVLATFKNVRGDEFLRATELAQDMATVMGTDLSGSAVQLGKALNDPLAGMSALSKVGVSFTDEQKQLADQMIKTGDVAGAQNLILNELAGQFGGAAQSAAEADGGFTQFWNRVGDLKETLGEGLLVVLEALMPVFEGAVIVAENLAAKFGVWKDSAVDLADSFGLNMDTFKDWGVAIVEIVSRGQVMFENFGDVIKQFFRRWLLDQVQQAEEMKHFFTSVIPELLTFFADNWSEIFTDIGNYTATVFSNMWENAQNFFVSVVDWLAGNEASFEFKGLTEGFEATLKELPQITARQKGPFEKSLIDLIDSTDAKMEQRVQERLRENLNFLSEITSEAEGQTKGDITNDAKAIDTAGLTTLKDTEKKKTDEKTKEEKKRTKVTKDEADKRKEITLGTEDLLALRKRIAESAATFSIGGNGGMANGVEFAGSVFPASGSGAGRSGAMETNNTTQNNKVMERIDKLITLHEDLLKQLPFQGRLT